MSGLVGVYGGTFDPIHVGHITAAKQVQQALAMDFVHMVLSAQPPHRSQPTLTAAQRFKLLQLATDNEACLVADDCEMRRAGPSYMIDTLCELKQTYSTTSLALIMGMEAFNGITHWHRYEALLDVAHIVVTDRAGFDNQWHPSVVEFVRQHQIDDQSALKRLAHGKIYRHDVMPIDISATAIRTAILQGQSVKDNLHPAVWKEITTNNWYQSVNQQ